MTNSYSMLVLAIIIDTITPRMFDAVSDDYSVAPLPYSVPR